jgi:hypothetical protein
MWGMCWEWLSELLLATVGMLLMVMLALTALRHANSLLQCCATAGQSL